MGKTEEKTLNRLSPLQRKLVLENMKLVPYMAERSSVQIPDSMTREDILQCGYVGLVEAALRYEKRQAAFSTYACIRIFGSIEDGANPYRTLRRNDARAVRRWRSAQELLKEKNGNSPTEEETAEQLCLSTEQGRTLEMISHLEVLSYEDAESVPYGKRRETDSVLKRESITESAIERMDLLHAMKKLTETERNVIRGRYYEKQSYSELSEKMHLKRSQVVKIHETALHKLKQLMSG